MFFAVLKEARRIHIEERNLFLVDLCNVSAASMNGKTYEASMQIFRDRVLPKRKPNYFDAADPKTAQILSSMLRPARILAGGA